MCRIAGIISTKISVEERKDIMIRMCEALRHGGPDDGGLFADNGPGLVLGNRRLSIVDLRANGHMPMSDRDGKVWITYNGEIYNFREIRSKLIAGGHVFTSYTDTEVILHAYREWGVESFRLFHGMFAFALYDVSRGKLFLARDRNGIKPLYYHRGADLFCFASEVKALQVAGLPFRSDKSWPVRFLAYGHVPEPYTTLEGVFSLQKGHYLEWTFSTGTFDIHRFAFDEAPDLTSDPALSGARIRAGLQAAVRRQLVADAPIGVFLSGGIDSSLISLLANENGEQELRTISIYFNEKSYDERAFQSLVLKKIIGEKHIHLVRHQEFNEFFPRIQADMDMPTTDGINTWFISKYAHEDGLKAVLSGLGADELFGGYPSFNRIRLIPYLQKLPSPIFSLANFSKQDKYRKIAFLSNSHPLASYLLLRGLFVPGDIARILDMDVSAVNSILFDGEPFPEQDGYDEAHAAWFETNLYMQNQLLRDTDVMSMSHGLEVRVPFLDEQFQQVVRGVDPKLRFDRRRPKNMLINSFRGVLPESVWNRRKMGFTFPLQEWMGRHPQISDISAYKGSFARQAVKSFINGQMHWSKLYALYQIQDHV